MVFEVKQGGFEGPLEVLLELIEQKRLHINDVALSGVTDGFLEYAKNSGGFPLAEGAQFALVAATLLLIKSKSLLPNLSLTTEEEGSIEDLERRLRLLQRFRELSRHVRARFGKSPLYFPCEREVTPVFAPPQGLSISSLLNAVREVLASLPRAPELAKKTIQKVITLEEMIVRLKDRIASALRMSFTEFAGSYKTERVQVIVSFLALLELVKEGSIGATQGRLHGDIVMETGEVRTPRY